MLWYVEYTKITLTLGLSVSISPALVSDQSRNSHFWLKTNIRQPKTTKYSVLAEYSALFLYFQPKFGSLIHNQLKIGIINAKFDLFLTKWKSC
jgi:hypothetical protein